MITRRSMFAGFLAGAMLHVMRPLERLLANEKVVEYGYDFTAHAGKWKFETLHFYNDGTHAKILSAMTIPNPNNSKEVNLLQDVVRRLVSLATVPHARNLLTDGEGCPIEIFVCKKWKTREYVRDGIKCQELYGRLDPDIPCSCGADSNNAEVKELAKSLSALLPNCSIK